MTRTFLFSCLLALALPWAASAQTLYKWVDEDGNVSYHDRPPPRDSGIRVEEKRLGSSYSRGDSDAPRVPVVLYSVPKCASCDLARVYLDRNKIPYSEKNVEKDPKLQEELKKKTGGSLSVPTITVGSKVLNGYIESLLEGELKAAGYLGGGDGATAADDTAAASEPAEPDFDAEEPQDDDGGEEGLAPIQ